MGRLSPQRACDVIDLARRERCLRCSPATIGAASELRSSQKSMKRVATASPTALPADDAAAYKYLQKLLQELEEMAGLRGRPRRQRAPSSALTHATALTHPRGVLRHLSASTHPQVRYI